MRQREFLQIVFTFELFKSFCVMVSFTTSITTLHSFFGIHFIMNTQLHIICLFDLTLCYGIQMVIDTCLLTVVRRITNVEKYQIKR